MKLEIKGDDNMKKVNEIKTNKTARSSTSIKMSSSVLVSLGISMVMAFCLKTIEMSLTVIFPTSAPIWMGFSTMLFMSMKG